MRAEVACLSDGAEFSSTDGGRRYREQQPPRLAVRIRSATLAKARRVRQTRSQQSSSSVAEWPFHPVPLGPTQAWEDEREPSPDSQGDPADLHADAGHQAGDGIVPSMAGTSPGMMVGTALGDPIEFGANYWPSEPSPWHTERPAEEENWEALPYGNHALDPTRWPPSLHNYDVPPDDLRTRSLRRESPPDVLPESEQPRPTTSYLSPVHRQRIREVLMEQRINRREHPAVPHDVSMPPPSRGGPRLGDGWWLHHASNSLAASSMPSSPASPRSRGGGSSGSGGPTLGEGGSVVRPPSRGGESSQPLGFTTPPAYEHITPEHYEQNQQHHHSLQPSSFIEETSSSAHDDISDAELESRSTSNEQIIVDYSPHGGHPLGGHQQTAVSTPHHDEQSHHRVEASPLPTTPHSLEDVQQSSQLSNLSLAHARSPHSAVSVQSPNRGLPVTSHRTEDSLTSVESSPSHRTEDSHRSSQPVVSSPSHRTEDSQRSALPLVSSPSHRTDDSRRPSPSVQGVPDENSEIPVPAHLHSDTSQNASSCGASTYSSCGDQAFFVEEDVEIGSGEIGFKVDEWRPVQGASQDTLSSRSNEDRAVDKGAAAGTAVADPTEVHDEKLSDGASHKADAGSNVTSVTAAAMQVPASRMVNMAEPEARSHLADEMVNELMDKLLAEEILGDLSSILNPVPQQATEMRSSSSTSSTEPTLRHPTPIVPASVIVGCPFIENKSENSDSDSGKSERKTPPAPRRTPPEHLGDDGPSNVKSGSSSDDGHFGRELGSSARHAKDSRAPFGSLAAVEIGASQIPSAKDVGPPRPPSPPPDLRPAPMSSGAEDDIRGVRSREEGAELITQDLIELSLDEASNEYAATLTAQLQQQRRIATEAETRRARRNDNRSQDIHPGSSPPRARRSPPPLSTQGGDTESTGLSPSEGISSYGGADTVWMETMVEPFMDAVLTQLGVVDKEVTVQTPLADTNSWLPAVVEVMRSREVVAAPLSPVSPSSNASAPGQHEHDVASWTRLLADAFTEIAGEEVKAEPRVLGWRRPGYFRLPPDLRVPEGRDTSLARRGIK